NITMPLDTTLTINMTLAPLTIQVRKLMGSQEFVSSGQTEELECSTTGSRPQPQVSWWRDGLKLPNPSATVSRSANQTLSVYRLVPEPSDHGVVFTCRVENPQLPSKSLEESYKLNVHYIPKVELSMGMRLNPNAVREGSDVFFECTI
ncbi:unnamed protein product, partial [Meganyctiphanes norvegica]